MAISRIPFSEITGYEFFKYSFERGSLPIFIIDIPYKVSELSNGFKINMSSDKYFFTWEDFGFTSDNTMDNLVVHLQSSGGSSPETYLGSELQITQATYSGSTGSLTATYTQRPIYKSSQLSGSQIDLQQRFGRIGSTIEWLGYHTSDDYYLPAYPSLYTSQTIESSSNIISSPTDTKFGVIKTTGALSMGTNNAAYNSITSDYYNWFNDIIKNSKPYNPNNPHNGGDQPDPDDGGNGDFDYTPDPIDIPDLPTVTATSSGLVTLYAPTSDQLKALADYLWSDAFSLESFKKLFNNPMDAILGLYLIPVNVGTGAAKEITVGNLVSTVSCNTVTTQYVPVDCGTFTFSKSAFTNSFLDWSPYTKCYLYLPFIGTQEINIDEFMGTTMHVVYHVDVMTGAMMCYVSNSTDGVIYEYMGQCSENIPLSSTSYSNTIGSILNAAAAVGGVVATAVTGGAAAPAALGMLGGASTATAQAASSLKPSVAHSGNIGGGAGIMSVNYPYLIFITPRTNIPSSQYKYVGTPSNKVVKLSSLSGTGFNQIEAINLSVKGATDTECAEIDATLKAGVIL